MIPYKRPKQPEYLVRNYKQWGRNYHKRRAENSNARFNWPQIKKQNVGKLIRDLHLKEFGDYCAYCDGPLGESSPPTLDHFRPKSRYPRLVLVWHNLFLCCYSCQQAKSETYQRKLLKPDQTGYRFTRYFTINYRTGALEANPCASTPDRERAEYTLELLRLNSPARKMSRLRILSITENQDFPYRYLNEPCD